MDVSTIVNGMLPANDPRGLRSVQMAVVEMEGAWRIFVDGQKVGRFSRHADALQCALEIAAETRRGGLPVEVLSQTAFGEVTVVPGLTG